MKKRRVLKKWVVYLLIMLTTLEFCVLTGEFESLGLQCIFTLILGFCAYMNAKIIKKWGNIRIGDDEDVLL